jgi:hypothetical protein
VRAAGEDEDLDALQPSGDQRAGMGRDLRDRHAGQFGIGDADGIRDRVGERAEAGTEHDADAIGRVAPISQHGGRGATVVPERGHQNRSSIEKPAGSNWAMVKSWPSPVGSEQWISVLGCENSFSRSAP